MSSPLTPPAPDRFTRMLPALAAVALVVFILRGTSDVLLPALAMLVGILQPVVVAFAIAYLLDPVVDRLELLRLPRGLAIAVLGVGLLLVATAAVALLVPSVIAESQVLLPKLTLSVRELTDHVRTSLGEQHAERLRQATEWATGALASFDWSPVAARVRDLVGSAASGGLSALSWLIDLLLIPVLAVYLLHDIDRIREQLAELIPRRYRDTVLVPAREVDAALAGFVRGQLLIALILGCLYALGLGLSGTPLGVPLGLVAGALSFIPYLGLALGLIPALLLTLVAHGLGWQLACVLLTFTLAQLLEGWVITPRVMRGAVGLHPVLVIMAVVAGGTLAGVTGMLLGVPCAAAAMVFIRRGHAWYVTSPIMLGQRALKKSSKQ